LSSASTRSAWPASTSPAAVSRAPRGVRSTSGRPASRSSAAICWEIADGVYARHAAAPASEPCRAISTSERRRWTSSMKRSLLLAA
jgi:hypothetical protein